MVRVERFFMTALMCVGAVASLQAQAIVDATGGGSYTTISDALAAHEADIVVKNTGVYEESLLITYNVDLRGEDPANPPVIAITALPSQPSLGSGDGIYLGGDGQSSDNLEIKFSNFIVIPAVSNSPTDDAFSVTANPNGILKLTMSNVLCAPNDGNDEPLATSVWENPDFTASGVVRIPDDGIYAVHDEFGGFNGDIQLTLQDVTIIGVGGGTTNGDAVVSFTGLNGNGSLTASGVGTSFSSRDALQLSHKNPVTVTGTRENPGWVARKNGVGLVHLQGSDVTLDHLVCVDNNDCGLRVDADSNANVTITNSVFARNWFQGVIIPWVPTEAKTWTISDCTFYNNDVGNNGIANLEVRDDVTADLTLNINDCIFAGTESEGIENTAGILTANNCAFVANGPDTLPASFIGTPPTENNSVNADPEFVNVDSDPLLADSFDVQSSAYATASSTAGPLNGWGDGPDALVRDWSVY